MLIDSEQKLWISTSGQANGLAKIKNEKLKKYTIENGLRSNDVRDLSIR